MIAAKRGIAVVLLALLAGCSSTTHTTTTAAITVTLADACNSYANALNQLTPIKSKLTPAQVDSINVANALSDPLCASGTAPTDVASATALVLQEVQVLVAIKGAH